MCTTPPLPPRQTQVFEQDVTQSQRVTLAQWQARPLHEKLKERLALLLQSQL